MVYFVLLWEDKNLEGRIKEALHALWSKEERLRRYGIGRRLVDGRGAIELRESF